MKLGRRAPSAGAYASLRASIEATLGLEVNLVEPHKLSVRQQLEEMSRAAVAVSPDGGASFACAFLADGAAVVILGYLERWIWANDRRVRAFYCAPRDDHLPCAPAIGSPSEGGDRSEGRSCYSVRSLQPCLDTMLRRALAYARLTWPALPPPPRGRGSSEGKSVKHGREGIPSVGTARGQPVYCTPQEPTKLGNGRSGAAEAREEEAVVPGAQSQKSYRFRDPVQ